MEHAVLPWSSELVRYSQNTGSVWGETSCEPRTHQQTLFSSFAMAHHDSAGGFGEPGSEFSLLGSVLSRCGSTGLLGEKEVAGENALWSKSDKHH